ncbi:MAG: hypothetical protein FWC36_01345, partial [Spirochaetes bacterium]|nr:hypothetical protein [Spirochaetota bacterium]
GGGGGDNGSERFPPVADQNTIDTINAILRNGLVGQHYDETLVVAANPLPTFEITGSLPPGLSQSGTMGERIYGTPTSAGIFPFDLTISNSEGSIRLNVSITIDSNAVDAEANAITLTCALRGSHISYQLSTAAGTCPFTWAHSGTLPPGLTLGTSGVISGTPTTRGTFDFSVTVTGYTGVPSAPVSASVFIAEPVIISPVSLPVAVVGTAYNQTITITGDTPTVNVTGLSTGGLSWSWNAGMGTGTISGTPTTAGNITFTISASTEWDSDAREFTITIAPALYTVPTLAAFTTAVENLTSVIQNINTGVTNVVSITINGSNAHFGTQQVAGFITNVTVTLNFTGPNIDNAVRAAVGNLIRNAGFTFADTNVTANSTPRFVLPMSQSEFYLAIRAFVLNDRVGTGAGQGSFTVNNLTINSYVWNNIGITIEFTAPVGTNLANSVARDRIRNYIINDLMATHKAAINPHASVNANHVAVTVVSNGPNVNELDPLVAFPPPVQPGVIDWPFVSPTMADIDAFMDLWRGNNTGSTAGGSIRDQVDRLVPVSVGSNTNRLVNFGMMALPQHIADISVATDGTDRRLFALRVPLAQAPDGENWPVGRALTQHPPNAALPVPGLLWRPIASSTGFIERAGRISPFPMFGPTPGSRESTNLVTNDGGTPLSYRIYIFEVGMTNFAIASTGWNNVVRARYNIPSGFTQALFENAMRAYYNNQTWEHIRDNIIGVAGGNTQTIVSITYTDYDIHGNVVFRFNATTVNTAVSPHPFAPNLPRPGGTNNEDTTPGGAVTNQLFNALTLYFWPRN